MQPRQDTERSWMLGLIIYKSINIDLKCFLLTEIVCVLMDLLWKISELIPYINQILLSVL